MARGSHEQPCGWIIDSAELRLSLVPAAGEEKQTPRLEDQVGRPTFSRFIQANTKQLLF